MRSREVVAAESAGFEYGYGQRISHAQSGRSAGCGRQVVWACFLVDTGIETFDSSSTQRRRCLTGHGNQGYAHAFNDGQ